MIPMRLWILIAVTALATGAGSVSAAERDGGRVCYTQAETRQSIASHHLVDPFSALRNAAVAIKAEPLMNRLCKWGDEFVYEMTLLPKNGKVTRVYLRAQDGSPINAQKN